MSWRVRLSEPARRDIQHALRHTLERFGAAQHDDYQALIRLALVEIATNPTSIRAKRRPELHPDAFAWHIARPGRRARHLFIYRIGPDDVVEIARFLHDAMDIKRHLPDEFTG